MSGPWAQRMILEWLPGYWLKPRERHNPHVQHPGHLKCPCGEPVGHMRHYYRGTPNYHCECGFYASTRRALEKHLQTGKGRVQGSPISLTQFEEVKGLVR